MSIPPRPSALSLSSVLELLDLGERVASLSSSSVEVRISTHLSGLNSLVDARHGFLVVARKKESPPSEPQATWLTSLLWCGVSPEKNEHPDEQKGRISSCLDDPTTRAVLHLSGHRSCLLGERGQERRLVAFHSVSNMIELCLGFERDPLQRPFSSSDEQLLLLVMLRQGSFYRRLARELGALGAKRLLSPRERDVLGLLLTGLSEKEMANRLGMTTRSIHQRVTSLYRNYGVRSRPELMACVLHDS